jgi:hypothetical protein
MMKSTTIWVFLAAGCWLAHGCGDAGAVEAELATRSSSNGDGGTTACESDLDCPAGEECELEHGGSFCKPHGGDDGEDSGSGRSGGTGGIHGGSGGAGGNGAGDGSGLDCISDADCPIGEECEIEHGRSFCKPHGDDDDLGHGNDDYDDDDYDDRSGSNRGKG